MIIFKCDECKEILEPNQSLWTVGVKATCLSYGDLTSQYKSIQVCPSCLESLGISDPEKEWKGGKSHLVHLTIVELIRKIMIGSKSIIKKKL